MLAVLFPVEQVVQTNLQVPTTFRITGDVSAEDFVFDGQVGGSTKTFSY